MTCTEIPAAARAAAGLTSVGGAAKGKLFTADYADGSDGKQGTGGPAISVGDYIHALRVIRG